MIKTREELRVWAWDKIGWECYSWTVGQSTPRTFWGYRLRDQLSPLSFHACTTEADAHMLAARITPDSTQDIAAAFALKDWLQTQGSFEARRVFADEWHEAAPSLCAEDAQEFALWLVCAVFYAVTGERVEVKE